MNVLNGSLRPRRKISGVHRLRPAVGRRNQRVFVPPRGAGRRWSLSNHCAGRPPGTQRVTGEKALLDMQTGLEQFIAVSPQEVADRRLGLLCNPASVDRHYTHARDLIRQRFPGRLKALYSPQHGFFAQKQDNMIESADAVDPVSGLPVFSLYGETRIPTEEMLAPIDVLVVDLQDVGTRVYTFIYTLSYCLESARRFGKQVVVLDRPNPLGGQDCRGQLSRTRPGPPLSGATRSPCATGSPWANWRPISTTSFDIGCDLVVVPMKNWRRSMYFEDTGLPWVAPSPNLPTPASAMVYPGQVIWEGTNCVRGAGNDPAFRTVRRPLSRHRAGC